MCLIWKKASFMRRAGARISNLQDEEEGGEDKGKGICRCNYTLLDLPDLVIENILDRLSAESLCYIAAVNRELRSRSTKDYLWERILQAKWGRLLGHADLQELQVIDIRPSCSTITSSGSSAVDDSISFWRRPLSCLWPFNLLFPRQECAEKHVQIAPPMSAISLYSALESGRLWFPAQVYNRENGHVGFMLSCYDAELSYVRATNTFSARYPPHGIQMHVIEESVTWDRVRRCPISTGAYELHITSSLADLKPGDHIEVQWRRNKEFPWGWWYGVVGHLDSCTGGDSCLCHVNDTVWLEFKQYTLGSRWRRRAIRRYDHREEGNETDGFYGGVRKLQDKDEINSWKGLWPKESLE